MLHCSEQALREPDFCKPEVSTSIEADYAFGREQGSVTDE